MNSVNKGIINVVLKRFILNYKHSERLPIDFIVEYSAKWFSCCSLPYTQQLCYSNSSRSFTWSFFLGLSPWQMELRWEVQVLKGTYRTGPVRWNIFFQNFIFFFEHFFKVSGMLAIFVSHCLTLSFIWAISQRETCRDLRPWLELSFFYRLYLSAPLLEWLLRSSMPQSPIWRILPVKIGRKKWAWPELGFPGRVGGWNFF